MTEEREKPRVRVRGDGTRCPFCHETLRNQDDKRGCSLCMAWHHRECWLEAGDKCASCGASDVPGRIDVRRKPEATRVTSEPQTRLRLETRTESITDGAVGGGCCFSMLGMVGYGVFSLVQDGLVGLPKGISFGMIGGLAIGVLLGAIFGAFGRLSTKREPRGAARGSTPLRDASQCAFCNAKSPSGDGLCAEHRARVDAQGENLGL